MISFNFVRSKRKSVPAVIICTLIPVCSSFRLIPLFRAVRHS